MRIAFYAPLKPPDHPVPSGDRMMARLLMRALGAAGHDVVLASRLRAYALAETVAAQRAIAEAGAREAGRLSAAWREDRAGAPDLWFTYHLYYRAPDWIGPAVADALRIPYALAEASFAMKRAKGVWSLGHEACARALARADIVFGLAEGDRAGLAKAEGFSAPVVDLAPFVDPGPPPSAPPRRPVVRLLAVAMMRARAKIESYRILARALARLGDLDWRLDVVGDGPARGEVEAEFGSLGAGRVSFHGALEGEELAKAYRDCDLMVWPGFDEAYGMVYLEAQLAGRPVVAMAHRGVANVVRDGASGRLVEAGDEDGFAHAMRELIVDAGRREALGRSARAFVERERSIDRASAILDRTLRSLRHAP